MVPSRWPGDVQHVVDAAHDPVISILVAARGVPGNIEAIAEFLPVGSEITLVVPPDRPQHRGPGPLDHEVAAGVGRFHGAPLVIDDVGEYSRQGLGAGAGLGRRHAGDGRHHDGPGFGLPPRIHDGAALGADDLVVPHPGFRIDGLTDAAQQAQLAQIVLAPAWRRPIS